MHSFTLQLNLQNIQTKLKQNRDTIHVTLKLQIQVH